MQHLSWWHFSISGISQLLLTQFRPNFKCRLLKTSLTDVNCHGDICQGNICLGNNCPYPILTKVFGPNILWYIFLDQNLVWHFFLPKSFFDPQFYGPKFFWTQNLSDWKLVWTKILIDLHFLDQISFQPKKFWTQHSFGAIYYLTQNIFGPGIY